MDITRLFSPTPKVSKRWTFYVNIGEYKTAAIYGMVLLPEIEYISARNDIFVSAEEIISAITSLFPGTNDYMTVNKLTAKSRGYYKRVVLDDNTSNEPTFVPLYVVISYLVAELPFVESSTKSELLRFITRLIDIASSSTTRTSPEKFHSHGTITPNIDFYLSLSPSIDSNSHDNIATHSTGFSSRVNSHQSDLQFHGTPQNKLSPKSPLDQLTPNTNNSNNSKLSSKNTRKLKPFSSLQSPSSQSDNRDVVEPLQSLVAELSVSNKLRFDTTISHGGDNSTSKQSRENSHTNMGDIAKMKSMSHDSIDVNDDCEDEIDVHDTDSGGIVQRVDHNSQTDKLQTEAIEEATGKRSDATSSHEARSDDNDNDDDGDNIVGNNNNNNNSVDSDQDIEMRSVMSEEGRDEHQHQGRSHSSRSRRSQSPGIVKNDKTNRTKGYANHYEYEYGYSDLGSLQDYGVPPEALMEHIESNNKIHSGNDNGNDNHNDNERQDSNHGNLPIVSKQYQSTVSPGSIYARMGRNENYRREKKKMDYESIMKAYNITEDKDEADLI